MVLSSILSTKSSTNDVLAIKSGLFITYEITDEKVSDEQISDIDNIILQIIS